MIGVYCIESEDGSLYYGSSNNIVCRIKQHKYLLRNNKHTNVKLQRMWNKHEEDYFSFYPIEQCCLSILRDREQYWIDYLFLTIPLKHIYNFSKDARSAMGSRNHSSETKEKIRQCTIKQMSEAAKEHLRLINTGKKHSDITKNKLRVMSTGRSHSSETIEKLSKRMIGTKLSEETKEKIRIARKNQTMKPVSDETKQRMRNAALKRRILNK